MEYNKVNNSNTVTIVLMKVYKKQYLADND
jgi:hypothetical protein